MWWLHPSCGVHSTHREGSHIRLTPAVRCILLHPQLWGSGAGGNSGSRLWVHTDRVMRHVPLFTAWQLQPHSAAVV